MTKFNIKAIQILMGDSDPSMIMKVYNSIHRGKLMNEVSDSILDGLTAY